MILWFDLMHLIIQTLNFILVILYHFILSMELFLFFSKLIVFDL